MTEINDLIVLLKYFEISLKKDARLIHDSNAQRIRNKMPRNKLKSFYLHTFLCRLTQQYLHLAIGAVWL